jgi:hypothetical protein
MQFMTKKTSLDKISIGYNNIFISNTKFLVLVITNSLSWKLHVTHLTPELCKTCYVLRCIRPFVSQDTLKSVAYSYFHSLISYGIIFWCNFSNSLHTFQLQQRAVRIITGSRPRDSCRGLFRKLRILPLQSQYILCFLLFVVNNKSLFHVNSEIHGFNTRKILTFICLRLTCYCIIKRLTILALKFLIVSPPT